MAGTRITSGTLVANTVTHLTFTKYYSGIDVVNRGSTDIFARTDNTDPTVAGDDCEVIPAGTAATLVNLQGTDDPGAWPAAGTDGTDVRLISTGASAFTVAGTN